MAVYVDHLTHYGGKGFWAGKKSCHMFADSLEELHEMATKIGLKREWFQNETLQHYDLVEGRRKAALKLGAIEADRKKVVEAINKTRIKRGLIPFGQRDKPAEPTPLVCAIGVIESLVILSVNEMEQSGEPDQKAVAVNYRNAWQIIVDTLEDNK